MGTASIPIVSLQGRYGRPRRGEIADGPLLETVWAFSLPGQWTAIDPNSADCDWTTGELVLPWNVMGLPYNEVMVTYTAGLATIGDDIKIGVRADRTQRPSHTGSECQQNQDRYDVDAILLEFAAGRNRENLASSVRREQAGVSHE